ncbi:MAG TPA: ROK family protein [Ktedonobacterales bacterium]|nr:ROK family protein [Ktedonobacterales bacterium]
MTTDSPREPARQEQRQEERMAADVAKQARRAAVVAVDLGGTTTRVATILLGGETGVPSMPSAPATFATEPDYAAQIAQLGEMVDAAAGLVRRRDGPLLGVGVSLGGRIAVDGASVAVAPNLRDYEGRPLVQDVMERCDGVAPVRLAHDALCGLLAEQRLGALAGMPRCAYLTLSTGTGSAIHLESPAGVGVYTSIELGHQILDGNTRVCLCGQVGCLETFTGGRQLEQRYGQPIETLSADQWAALRDELVEKLSLGLVNLAHLTRVEAVAIGGAIALHHPELLPALRVNLRERLCGARLDLVPARWGADAPLIGAALLLTTPMGAVIH